ncbi:hypothetical protein WR25_22253 [Diploscapter pachys]|uniref:Uncharacterized protein n=1 Tax=Diploscapter pachys TaxID=2018661 RepID=A0A2A2K0M3_9BILA|nr:hypothetical protein WR25_22253 [Diploscapter pachys]
MLRRCADPEDVLVEPRRRHELREPFRIPARHRKLGMPEQRVMRIFVEQDDLRIEPALRAIAATGGEGDRSAGAAIIKARNVLAAGAEQPLDHRIVGDDVDGQLVRGIDVGVGQAAHQADRRIEPLQLLGLLAHGIGAVVGVDDDVATGRFIPFGLCGRSERGRSARRRHHAPYRESHPPPPSVRCGQRNAARARCQRSFAAAARRCDRSGSACAAAGVDELFVGERGQRGALGGLLLDQAFGGDRIDGAALADGLRTQAAQCLHRLRAEHVARDRQAAGDGVEDARRHGLFVVGDGEALPRVAGGEILASRRRSTRR